MYNFCLSLRKKIIKRRRKEKLYTIFGFHSIRPSKIFINILTLGNKKKILGFNNYIPSKYVHELVVMRNILTITRL